MRIVYLVFCSLVLPTLLGLAQESTPRDQLRDEEARDYYQEWLREDVLYLITEEEEEVFNRLSTAEEKEKFIEQFWFRRDPDPTTAANEFKEEHYRRIAYANERFASGLPGWMTDRGRVYIIHGHPDEIESYPTGGQYDRPFHEGGGTTVAYPFEVWRYRHIPGVGSDIELEFVDPSMSGEYRLALGPEEKDAFLNIPGAGATLAEELGLAKKSDRPFFSPANRESYPLMGRRSRDTPFARYERYAMVQRPVEVKYTDLQEMVEVDVGYSELPLRVHEDYFRLNESKALVPVTLQIDNKELTFRPEGTSSVARVAVYGMVTSLAKRVVLEFEDDLSQRYRAEELPQALERQALYQKVIPIDVNSPHKLTLVVKDLNSEKVGTLEKAIRARPFDGEDLEASSVLLSNEVTLFKQVPDPEEMFVLGDVKIRPKVDRQFTEHMPLVIYFQLYNAALDQSTLQPSLEITYRLFSDGELLSEISDKKGESIQFHSDLRVVLIKGLSLQGLPGGDYHLRMSVKDRLTGRTLELSEVFQVVGS